MTSKKTTQPAKVSKMELDKDGRPVFQHRNREHRPEASEKYISTLLEQLRRFELQTRPSGGDKTAAGKDLAACGALQMAGMLYVAVAGWAINHTAGRGLAGLSFVPLVPQETKLLPDYQAARLLVDTHDHEKTGSNIAPGLVASLPPDQARNFVLNVLTMLEHIEPNSIALIVDALHALEFNEIRPVVAVTEKGKRAKDTYAERASQLEAICLVEKLCEQGRSKLKSQKLVAEHYGVSELTLRSWESRLRVSYGNALVHARLRMARNLVKNNNPTFEFLVSELKAAAQKYKAAQRQKRT